MQPYPRPVFPLLPATPHPPRRPETPLLIAWSIDTGLGYAVHRSDAMDTYMHAHTHTHTHAHARTHTHDAPTPEEVSFPDNIAAITRPIPRNVSSHHTCLSRRLLSLCRARTMMTADVYY